MASQSATTDDSLVRTILLIVALVLLVPFLVMAFAMPMMGMWGGGHMWDWNGAGPGWAWLLGWLVFLLVIGGVGYLLLRAISGTAGQDTDAALEELRVAYARGELSNEEFEERRQRLERER